MKNKIEFDRKRLTAARAAVFELRDIIESAEDREEHIDERGKVYASHARSRAILARAEKVLFEGRI